MAPQNPPLVSLLFLLLLPVPSQLYSLHNCFLYYTSLSDVNCAGGQLSEMLSEVPNFAVHLSVVSNSIARLRQNDLSGLNKLQSLGLENISYIEPGAFLHSPGLLRLYLYRNKLTNLTDETFKGLSNLAFLNLGYSRIKFISNSAFEHLKNLQELDLSGIGLTHVRDIAIQVSSCPMLQVLILTDNNFTSFESVHFQYPLNITDLDLSENPLRRFTLHTNVFPHLQSLSLSHIRTRLQWDVSDKAFLLNLKTLNLKGVNFPIETYKSIFQSAKSVETLTLGFIGYLLLDRGLLRFACAIPSLQKLDLNSNALPVLNNTLLQPCFNITDLDLSGNSLEEFSQSSLRMLTRLSWLNIAENYLVQVPLTIQNMSSLTYLSIKTNAIERLGCLDFSGLWMLTELNLSNNRLFELDSCVFQDLHRLKILDISYNSITQLDDGFSTALTNLLALNAENNADVLQRGVFKNMSHLRELTIGKAILMDSQAFEGLRDLRFLSFSTSFESNETSIGLASPSEGKFVYMPLLQTLIIHSGFICIVLGANTFQGLGNLTTFSSTKFFCKPHSEMFRNTPLLEILEMTDNDRWANPDPKLFQPIRRLKNLDLSRNRLKSLDVLSEASLTELETLILAHNELRVINVAILKTLPSLKYLDLSGNAFVCNCSNADFIQWVLGNKQVYVVKAFQYRCAYPLSQEGEFLLAFNVRSCWEFAEFVSFISSFSLVLVTLLFSLIYHFLRWQIVYGYYLLQAFLYDGRKRRQGCAEVYDAFVSYSVHDEEWVYYTLVPELEERQGWRLCLHHRDFEPGKAILENITDAIYSSRKTLCVISRQYLLSEWCSREIQMASFRLFDEQKDVLVLLFLEEISSVELSPFYRMRKLVKTRTYLSWARARSHRNLFWEKVRRALESGNDPTDDHRDPLTANAI